MTDFDLAVAKRPMFLFKVGAPVGEPRDFSAVLARELPARLVTMQDVKEQFASGQAGANIQGRTRPKHTMQRLQFMASQALCSGSDLVADMYFNSPASRRNNILSTASRSGAVSVALFFDTDPAVIERRVTKRQARANRWGKSDESGYFALPAIRKMMDELVAPEVGEGLDCVIRLDGALGTEDLLDIVATELSEQGFLGEDPAA